MGCGGGETMLISYHERSFKSLCASVYVFVSSIFLAGSGGSVWLWKELDDFGNGVGRDVDLGRTNADE